MPSIVHRNSPMMNSSKPGKQQLAAHVIEIVLK
jgi:hypothetical protein